MARDGEKGSFSAAVPEDLIAEALAAVEKPRPAAPEGTPAPVAAPADDLEPLRAQLRDAQDLRLRALADLDNLKKRLARDREDAQRSGTERLVRDLLPALDNLDRALAAAPDGPLAAGVALTRRLLEDALARNGITSFSVAPGAAFDPRLHHALMTVESAEHAAGTVVSASERGYRLHDRLLRPASVVVAGKPPLPPGAGENRADGVASDQGRS